MGACNLPVSRIMLSNDYSGGRSPAQQWITGLEIWDGFPAASNVPTWSAGVRTGGLPAVSTTNAGKRFK